MKTRRDITTYVFTVSAAVRAVVLWCVMALLGACGQEAGDSAEGAVTADSVDRTSDMKAYGVASDREYALRLSRLSCDSLFRLGARHTVSDPVVPDSAMMAFVTLIRREDEMRGDTAAMKEIAKAYVNSAYIYSAVYRNFSKAYTNLRKAEKLCGEYRLQSVLPYVYINMGVTLSLDDRLHSSLPRPPEETESARYYRMAFDSALEARDYDILAFSVFNMSISHELESGDPVLEYLRRYLAADIPDTDTLRPYLSAICRGLLDYTAGDYAAAHGEFAKTFDVDYSLKSLLPRMREQGRYLDALVYERSGDTATAVRILNGILEESRARGDMESQMDMYGNLYVMHRDAGDSVRADRCLLGYYRAREAIAAMGGDGTVTEARLEESLDKYETDMEQLRQHERRIRRMMIYGAVVGVLVILILVMSLVYSRRRRRYVMALYEKNLGIMTAGASPETDAVDDGGSVAGPSSDTILPDKELVDRITAIIDGSHEVFDPDFGMARLCAMVGSNTTYVSRAVNAHYGRPFKTVMAERRVAEACRRLDNPVDNAGLTIEAICHEVGFRSRAAFSVAFKNVTGLTPSEYRKASQRYMPPMSL